MAFFAKSLDKLKGALKKTAAVLNTDVRTLFVPGRKIDDAFLEEMESNFIRSDMGVKNAERVVAEVRDRWRLGKIRNAEQAGKVVRETLIGEWPERNRELIFADSGPTVVMVCGVNGAGKTTSIAKLAWLLTEQYGKTVMLAAGDTFRAAAIEQLSIWADRLGVEVVKHKHGVDPAAVVWDACDAAVRRKVDVLIVDTAGRLHTQDGLMRELGKIRGTIAKKIEGGPHETILVLDATAGQNAVRQAEHFHAVTPLTGLFLAKMDGSAKGGFVLTIRNAIDVPVKLIGLGETPADVESFDPARFIDALFRADDEAASHGDGESV